MMGRMIQSTKSHPARSSLCDLLFGRLVASGFVFNEICCSQPDGWLLCATYRTLQAEYIDVEADREGLGAFVNWLRAQRDDPDGMIASFLERMAREFPSPVWQG